MARAIDIMSRVFTNGAGDGSSTTGRVILRTQKWYLMPRCLTLNFLKVRIKGKVDQSRKWSCQ